MNTREEAEKLVGRGLRPNELHIAEMILNDTHYEFYKHRNGRLGARPVKPTTGLDLISHERERQINHLGYTIAKDLGYTNEQLVLAAICYLKAPSMGLLQQCGEELPMGFPWELQHWNPSPLNRKRELVKAGALIVAELDRLLEIN